ncbi:MAG: hypothetical protein B7Z68_09305 [Acidobacteria bacterium 21-70-11]|nr:MAG: hypothetical protein B7Z68_09305 [Acidobacteria bacterium 21-70-11]
MDETPRTESGSMGLPIRPPEPGKRLTFFGFFRARFVTGLLVSFPLVVTLFFGRFLFDLIDRWADPISRRLFDRPVPGFGAAVFVVGVFLLGVLAHNVIGRRVLQFGERLFARIPVLRAVYTGTREVTRAFAGNRAKSFRRVVLVPFPNENVWAVAFVTTEFEEATPDGPRRVTAVFMPTTPNPTTGFFLVYPATAVRATDMSVEEAIRMVISGGLVSASQGRVFPAAPAPKDSVP